jgi:hypothetical protein
MQGANLSASEDRLIQAARMRIDSLLRGDVDGATLQGAGAFIADLRHWCDGKGISFDAALAEAELAYRSDYNGKAMPPAQRLLELLEASRAELLGSGVPAQTLDSFIAIARDKLSSQVANTARVERVPDSAFEASLRQVGFDQWQQHFARQKSAGVAPKVVRDVGYEKINSSGARGPARDGAIQALGAFCDQNGIQFDRSHIAAQSAPVSALSVSERAKRANGGGKRNGMGS